MGMTTKGYAKITLSRLLLGWAVMVAGLGGPALAEQSGIKTVGLTTVFTQPTTAKTSAVIDYAHAKPMAAPVNQSYTAARSRADKIRAFTYPFPGTGIPGFAYGWVGTGITNPVTLTAPTEKSASAIGITPDDFGTSNQPFTTARADLYSLTTTNNFPYRASGKLFFKIGSSTYVCSASMIRRGIVVTAAHCVANFGTNQFYTNWTFVPAYRNGVAPYGTWTVAEARILTSYLDGTDSCAQSGVVCQDDVAVLTLNTQGGGYVGSSTGWYSYGYNGYGFTGGATQVTQLGYPVCLDNGEYMERNDSFGVTSSSNSNNTVIGSLMCGGSSGGPWLVNFGLAPSPNGTSFGSASRYNTIVGVTSWGYTDLTVKGVGAAPFTNHNIVTLLSAECGVYPAACS